MEFKSELGRTFSLTANTNPLSVMVGLACKVPTKKNALRQSGPPSFLSEEKFGHWEHFLPEIP